MVELIHGGSVVSSLFRCFFLDNLHPSLDFYELAYFFLRLIDFFTFVGYCVGDQGLQCTPRVLGSDYDSLEVFFKNNSLLSKIIVKGHLKNIIE
jgi:hypothetical protein